MTDIAAKSTSQIPTLTLNPTSWWKWWVTPRATQPGLAFRERSIRLLLMIFVPLFIFNIGRSVTTNSYQTLPGGF